MRHPIRIRHLLVAAAATMVASACASEADPLEAVPSATAAPATSEAPATTSSTAPEPTACEDPSAEYLGDGRYERDGRVYEMTDVGCLFRPNRPEDTATAEDPVIEAVPAPEQPCPEGEHRHGGGEDCHPDDHGPDPEEGPQAPPVLVVDPAVVPEGLNTFTLEGSGFDPSLEIVTLICPLASGVSEGATEGQVAAAVDALEASDCDLDSIEAAAVDSDGSFTATRDNIAVDGDFVWVASDPDKVQAAGAAVFVESPEPESVAPTTTTTPPTTTAAPTTTTTPPTTTAPTTTTTPPTTTAPTAVRASISAPLARCSPADWFGSGLLAVLAGTSVDGFYEPVVRYGDDSCERIKAAWDDIRAAEADRIARGGYPCEYTAAYNYWPAAIQTAGSAMLTGCWPRLLTPGNPDQVRDDPASEAYRLWNREGFWILPPNHPALVEALYDCYRDALQGPPADFDRSVAADRWPGVSTCNRQLDNFGNPVRDYGVSPECAAEMLRGKLAERKARGFVGEEIPATGGEGTSTIYAGDFSWANCPTSASRLLTGAENSYRERCEAVVDASAGTGTEILADVGGVDPNDVIAVVKSMFCDDGTLQTLRDRARVYQDFVPDWNEPYGDFVAGWTPGEGSVCQEAAMLVAAQKATSGRWVRVKHC